MIPKRILVPERIRKVPPSFSWVDHRLLREGHLDDLPPAAMLLYFFLVLVGDQHGLSYYSLGSISNILKYSPTQLTQARTSLCRQDLIAYIPPLYQVLSLPLSHGLPCESRPSSGPQAIGDILKPFFKEQSHGH